MTPRGPFGGPKEPSGNITDITQYRKKKEAEVIEKIEHQIAEENRKEISVQIPEEANIGDRITLSLSLAARSKDMETVREVVFYSAKFGILRYHGPAIAENWPDTFEWLNREKGVKIAIFQHDWGKERIEAHILAA